MIQVRATTRMRWACALLVLGFALPYWKAPAARLRCELRGMTTTHAAFAAVYGPALQRASLTADPQAPMPRRAPLAMPVAAVPSPPHASAISPAPDSARAAPPLRI